MCLFAARTWPKWWWCRRPMMWTVATRLRELFFAIIFRFFAAIFDVTIQSVATLNFLATNFFFLSFLRFFNRAFLLRPALSR